MTWHLTGYVKLTAYQVSNIELIMWQEFQESLTEIFSSNDQGWSAQTSDSIGLKV